MRNNRQIFPGRIQQGSSQVDGPRNNASYTSESYKSVNNLADHYLLKSHAGTSVDDSEEPELSYEEDDDHSEEPE